MGKVWPNCEQSIHAQNPNHKVCSDQHCEDYQNTSTYHDNCLNSNPLDPISTMQCVMPDGSIKDIWDSNAHDFNMDICYQAGGKPQMCYCCCACYAVGTPITIFNPGQNGQKIHGTKPIEQFNIGDSVLTASVKVSNNKLNLSWKESEVGFSNGSNKGHAHMMFIYYGNEDSNSGKEKLIITTPDHLFLMPDGKMKRADTLVPIDPKNTNVGDMLISRDGTLVPVNLVVSGLWEKGVHHIATSLPSGEEYQKFDGNTDNHFIESNGVVCGDYYLQLHQKELQSLGLMENLDNIPAFSSEDYFKKYPHVSKLLTAPGASVTKIDLNLPEGFKTFLSPNNIPAYAGKFFTDMQAKDVAKNAQFNPMVSHAGQDNVNYLFSLYKSIYPNINFYLDWAATDVNAYSFYSFGKQQVVISGQLVRLKGLYYEGLAYIIAHCIARMQGGKPYVQIFNESMTYVGAADFYATSDIMRKVLYQNYDDNMIDNLLSQVKQLFGYISDDNKKGDPNDLYSNPSIDCRFNSISTGIAGGNVLPCAGGGTIGGLQILNFKVVPAHAILNWILSISFNKELDPKTVINLNNYKLKEATILGPIGVKISGAHVKVLDNKTLSLDLLSLIPDIQDSISLVISNIEAMDGSTLDTKHNSIIFKLV